MVLQEVKKNLLFVGLCRSVLQHFRQISHGMSWVLDIRWILWWGADFISISSSINKRSLACGRGNINSDVLLDPMTWFAQHLVLTCTIAYILRAPLVLEQLLFQR